MHISIHSPGQCTRISASATSGKYLIFPQAFLLHEVKREPAENPPSVTSTTWEMTETYVPHGWRRISQETMPVAIYVCTAVRIGPTIRWSRAPGPPLYRFISADGTWIQHIVCHWSSGPLSCCPRLEAASIAFCLLLDIRVRATIFSHTNGPHGNQTFD